MARTNRSLTRQVRPLGAALLVLGLLLLPLPGPIARPASGHAGPSGALAVPTGVRPASNLNASCPQGTGRTITGYGEDSMLPPAGIWIGTYRYDAVVYSPQGLSAAFTNLETRAAPLAAGIAGPTYAQRLGLPGLLQLPIGATDVAIIVNVPGVSVPLNLSGPVLAQVYLGTITQWDDPAIAALNPGISLPAASILVTHRSDADGSTLLFTQFLSKTDATWASSVGNGSVVSWPLGSGIRGANGVLTYVDSTPDAIGYLPYPTAVANAENAGNVAALVGGVGVPEFPSAASAAAAVTAYTGSLPPGSGNWSNVTLIDEAVASVYPIVGFDYLYFLQEQNRSFSAQATPSASEALWNLLDWIVGRTGAGETAIGVGALEPSIRYLDLSTLASVTWNGTPLASIAPECAVTFTASGLPPGTSWGITLGPTPNETTGAEVGFFLPNGSTFPFTVAVPPGYFANPSSGNVSPNGSVASRAIVFGPGTAIAPAVTQFVATPSPVVLGQPLHFAVSVSGGALPLSFAYAGLPAGCASANASQLNCTPSATGAFNVTVWANDTAGRSSHAYLLLSVITTGPNSGPILGASVWLGYLLIGLVLPLAILLVALVYWRRRRGPPPGAPSPPRGSA